MGSILIIVAGTICEGIFEISKDIIKSIIEHHKEIKYAREVMAMRNRHFFDVESF